MNKFLSFFISLIIFTAVVTAAVSCTDNSAAINRLTNNSHLDHLYEEIEINNIKMAIIHIYAEYPDYKWVDDDDEGTACVDDAARAAVYYIRDYKYFNTKESLNKAVKLLEFILYMQDETALINGSDGFNPRYFKKPRLSGIPLS